MPFGELPHGWALAGALTRWALYVSAPLAAGSAIFVITLALEGPVARAAMRIGDVASAIAAIAYLLTVGLLGADLLDTPGAIFTGTAWQLGAQTNLMPSALMGIVAMAILSVGFRGAAPARSFLFPLGAMLTIGSFLIVGHAATAAPRWLAALSVAIHVAGVGFWLGALGPLAVAVRILPAGDAGQLLTRFSRFAAWAVGAIVASGLAIAWLQLRQLQSLVTTAYGARLDIKLALVVLLLALAARNRFALTPRLQMGDLTAAAAALRRAIILEYLLFLVILAAAASLTLVEPPRVPIGL
jgi:copper transport protein